MRYFVAFVFLVAIAAAQDQKPASCLILKHASVSSQMWVSGANWRYVAGDFPPNVKWKSNVRDGDIRKIKKLGGKVVVVGQDYTVLELESAKKECGLIEPPPSAAAPASAISPKSQ